MMQEKKKFLPLTSSDVCRVYDLLLEKGEISFPCSEETASKVETLVANILGVSFGTDHYPTSREKICAYLYFIIKDHPFVDGNKRTACAVFLTLCELNDMQFLSHELNLDEVAVLIEKSKYVDHQIFIRDLSKLLF